MMRISEFLHYVFDLANRSHFGNWVFFRDSHPDTLVALRFDDESDGASHPPTCILVTPDAIKVQRAYGSYDTSYFTRSDPWTAIEYIKKTTQL
jgi:hypothetical protein